MWSREGEGRIKKEKINSFRNNIVLCKKKKRPIRHASGISTWFKRGNLVKKKKVQIQDPTVSTRVNDRREYEIKKVGKDISSTSTQSCKIVK